MKITEVAYKWHGALKMRAATKYIVLHHRAGNGTVESIHAEHIARGWAGIGYHFYVRRDGSIYRGRPLGTWGAHCEKCNSTAVAVCFEGNFETEQMPAAQIRAGRELVSYLKGIYPSVAVKRHKDFDATACPGRNFPFEEIKKGAGYVKTELTSANDIIWELMHGNHKVNITEVDRAVKALDKARQNAEYSSLYWILRKIVNG